MITLTRMDGSRLTLNATMIEHLEATPDTVITMVSARKFVVKEPASAITRLVTDFYREIGLMALSRPRLAGSDTDES